MKDPDFIQNFLAMQKPLYYFAYRLTKNSDIARDLMQDTSLAILYKENLYTPGTKFSAWCFTIMYHIFVSQYWQKLRKNAFICDTHNFYLSRLKTTLTADNNLYVNEIHKVINLLPPLQKKLFRMYLAGYKYQEIAEIFGAPIGTIKSRMFQIRRELKKQLQ